MRTLRSLILCSAWLWLVGCGELFTGAVGQVAPSFSLESVDGSTFEIEAVDEDIVLVNFWVTQCGTCLKEIPVLNALDARDSVAVVGVALDLGKSPVRELAKKIGIEYPVVFGDQQMFEAYGGLAIPLTVVLDRNRVVRRRIVGAADGAVFERVITEITKES